MQRKSLHRLINTRARDLSIILISINLPLFSISWNCIRRARARRQLEIAGQRQAAARPGGGAGVGQAAGAELRDGAQGPGADGGRLRRAHEEDQAEVELLRRECLRMRDEMEEERRMLHMAEVWREERVQMKLSDAKYAHLNRLQAEMEAFLRSKDESTAARSSSSLVRSRRSRDNHHHPVGSADLEMDSCCGWVTAAARTTEARPTENTALIRRLWRSAITKYLKF